MPTIAIPAGSTSEPIEVGPGTRVTATGGYVQWTTGSMVDARNGVATWQTWPAGAVAGTEDTLRRIVMRGVATGAMTLTWDESRRDEGADTAYWQDSVPAWSVDSAGNVAGLVDPTGALREFAPVQQTPIPAFPITVNSTGTVMYGPARVRAIRCVSGTSPTLTLRASVTQNQADSDTISPVVFNLPMSPGDRMEINLDVPQGIYANVGGTSPVFELEF